MNRRVPDSTIDQLECWLATADLRLNDDGLFVRIGGFFGDHIMFAPVDDLASLRRADNAVRRCHQETGVLRPPRHNSGSVGVLMSHASRTGDTMTPTTRVVGRPLEVSVP